MEEERGRNGDIGGVGIEWWAGYGERERRQGVRERRGVRRETKKKERQYVREG